MATLRHRLPSARHRGHFGRLRFGLPDQWLRGSIRVAGVAPVECAVGKGDFDAPLIEGQLQSSAVFAPYGPLLARNRFQPCLDDDAAISERVEPEDFHRLQDFRLAVIAHECAACSGDREGRKTHLRAAFRFAGLIALERGCGQPERPRSSALCIGLALRNERRIERRILQRLDPDGADRLIERLDREFHRN